MGNYVAGGIVVYNSRTRTVKWQQHLDLSTDRTAFKAYVQASPTLADINGDGKLEVIIGTNMVGLLSLLHTSPALNHLTVLQKSTKTLLQGFMHLRGYKCKERYCKLTAELIA